MSCDSVSPPSEPHLPPAAGPTSIHEMPARVSDVTKGPRRAGALRPQPWVLGSRRGWKSVRSTPRHSNEVSRRLRSEGQEVTLYVRQVLDTAPAQGSCRWGRSQEPTDPSKVPHRRSCSRPICATEMQQANLPERHFWVRVGGGENTG